MKPNGPGPFGFVHASDDQALLPRVVSVGVSLTRSWSHGARAARLPTTRSQPAAGRQHQGSRLSRDGRFPGAAWSVPRAGFAGKTFQRAQYGGGAGVSSSVYVPVWVSGGGGAPPP